MLLPTWLAAAVREPTLIFVTEKGFTMDQGEYLPAKFIGNPSSNEAPTHAPEGKDCHGNGVQKSGGLVGHVLSVVPLSVGEPNELFNDGLGGVDDAGVVAKLEHAQDGGKDAIAQEEGQTLTQQPLFPALAISLQPEERVPNVVDFLLDKLNGVNLALDGHHVMFNIKDFALAAFDALGQLMKLGADFGERYTRVNRLETVQLF